MARPTPLMRDQKGCTERRTISHTPLHRSLYSATHHQLDLIPTEEEETQPRSRPQRSKPIDHHRVNLRSISRFGHAPLQNFLHFRNAVTSPLEQRLALTILNPGIRRESTNFNEGGAAEEESRAGVAITREDESAIAQRGET